METIKSSDEISHLFNTGKRYSNRYLTIIISEQHTEYDSRKLKSHGPCGRVAFIAGKKSGNAVWRNSAKRRMREIVRLSDDNFSSFNVLFVAKKSIMRDSYSKVLKAYEKTLLDVMSDLEHRCEEVS